MPLKLTFEEAQRNLEIARTRERRDLDAKHKGEVQDLEDRYKVKQELLKEIWSESGGDDPAPPSENGQVVDTASQDGTEESNDSDVRLLRGGTSTYMTVRRRSITNEVMIILEEMRDEVADDEIITQVPVRERYVEKYPGTDGTNLRSRISHTLKRASEEDGPLELVEKGAGSEPSKYRFRKRQGKAGLLDP